MKQVYLLSEAQSLPQPFHGNADCDPPASALRLPTKLSLLNIFLTQNTGKGPPGRRRTQEKVHSVFREHPPNAPPDKSVKSISINGIQSIYHNEKTTIYNNQN